jgi:thioredoxin-related protein
MKGLLILIAFLFVYSAWSSVENFPVEYPVKNYPYITDFEYDREVRDSDQYILLVFSSKDCLERTIIDRSCFLFEKNGVKRKKCTSVWHRVEFKIEKFSISFSIS